MCLVRVSELDDEFLTVIRRRRMTRLRIDIYNQLAASLSCPLPFKISPPPLNFPNPYAIVLHTSWIPCPSNSKLSTLERTSRGGQRKTYTNPQCRIRIRVHQPSSCKFFLVPSPSLSFPESFPTHSRQEQPT
jgi:hypothetical protein